MKRVADVLETVSVGAILPEVLIVAAILSVLLIDAFRGRRQTDAMVGVALLGTVLAGLATGTIPVDGERYFSGLVIADQFRRLFLLALSIAGAVGLVVSRTYLSRFKLPEGEYLILYLSSLLGMMIMVGTDNLALLFLGLELLSIPLYALTALRLNDPRSGEGALKYFLLGSAAGAMFLMGVALIYGETGTLFTIEAFRRMPLAAGEVGMQLGMALLLVAVAFKLAWVPFHPWSPDAYEGAPASVTAFMSTAVKVAIVGASGRLILTAFDLSEAFRCAIWVMAAATMVGGNLVAIVQTNIKRMLAYSSIAHAGYLGIAFYAGTPQAMAAAAFYAVIYTLMNIGAFGVLIALSRRGVELENFDDLRGLGHRRGWIALLIVVFFMSLSGIPPLAGFAAKLFLFAAGVQAGAVTLVVIGALSSVVGAYYYLRPLVIMFLHEGESKEATDAPPLALAALAALAVALVYLGLRPGGLLDQATAAVNQLVAGS